MVALTLAGSMAFCGERGRHSDAAEGTPVWNLEWLLNG
jgi:hypothetical protein